VFRVALSIQTKTISAHQEESLWDCETSSDGSEVSQCMFVLLHLWSFHMRNGRCRHPPIHPLDVSVKLENLERPSTTSPPNIDGAKYVWCVTHLATVSFNMADNSL
jgi:hypothetical protein